MDEQKRAQLKDTVEKLSKEAAERVEHIKSSADAHMLLDDDALTAAGALQSIMQGVWAEYALRGSEPASEQFRRSLVESFAVLTAAKRRGYKPEEFAAKVQLVVEAIRDSAN